LVKYNYYLNGKFIGSSTNNVFSFLPSEIEGIKNVNELKVTAFDGVYNKGEVATTLKLNI